MPRLAPLFALVALLTPAFAADPPKPAARPTGDADLVRKVITARKEYQQSLIALLDYYQQNGDLERAKWAEDELKSYHMAWKPSYRLDIQDVPPATLEPKSNIKEANEAYMRAVDYKKKGGTGTEGVLNQRRAEVLLQDILAKHPDSDKIADVAYELGDLYEGKTYHQYERAAAYYERSFQWRRGTTTDARLRAARLYDKTLNERTKAVEIYRDVIASDTDTIRIQEATKRLAELTGGSGGRK